MTASTATPETTAPVASSNAEVYEFEKGSWQHTLQLSAKAEDTSVKAKALAGRRLWLGTQAAVEFFMDPANDTPSSDPSGETLATQIKATGLSAPAISKIKNVALAARDRDDFDFAAFVKSNIVTKKVGNKSETTDKNSLDRADKAVRALVAKDKQPEVEAEQDTAFEDAVAAVAEVAPKTSTTVEGLLQIALAKAGDADEFVKVLLDVLSGPTKVHNPDAAQAFIRAFATENGARIKASKPEKATVAQKNAEKRAQPVKAKSGADKAGVKQAEPNPANGNGATAPQATPADEGGEPIDPATDDLWDDVDTDDAAPVAEPVAKTEPVAKAKPVKKATPIKRA